MEYRILGPLEVERTARRSAVKGRKPRALLALLLLHRNEPVAPEQLIDDLWGDEGAGDGGEHAPGLRLAGAEDRRRPPEDRGRLLPTARRARRAGRGSLRAARR